MESFSSAVSADELTQVFFQAADHDVVEAAFEHLNAAGEALGVEQFEQGAETVGVAIVGRGGEEKAVLEARREVADGFGDARINGVFGAARRGGVVSFVENQKRAGAQVVEPIAERSGVGFVNEQVVGDEKARKSCPGVHAVAAFLTDTFQVGAIEDFKGEAETDFQFVFPLAEH